MRPFFLAPPCDRLFDFERVSALMRGFSANLSGFSEQRHNRERRQPVLWLTVAAVCCFLGFASPARAEWGGSLSGTVDTRSDTSRATTMDQNGQVYVSGQPSARLQYLGILRYRRVQFEAGGQKPAWWSELQPTGELAWVDPYYTLRGMYQYRENRSPQTTNPFVARTAELAFQTNMVRLPRVEGRYQWSQNINDLDLVGRDTRMRLLAVGARYSVRQLSLSYDFGDQRTVNPGLNLERKAQEHTGRFNYGLNLFHKLASVQTSYQINDRSERELRGADAVTLISVLAVQGMYASDPAPEFGVLDTLSALIDNDLVVPASTAINLSGAETHNLGLDFGAPVEVDRLFLYTDTLANPNLLWSVYRSDDNQTWTQVRASAPAPFSTNFYRYEISFDKQASRYVKAVTTPILQAQPVYPTELRAYNSHSNTFEPDQSTDHRGSMDLQVIPAKWFRFGVGASVQRVEGSFSTTGREQDAVKGQFRLEAAAWAALSGNAGASRTRYPQAGQSDLSNEMYNLALESRWLPTLSTHLSVNRRIERLDERANRESNAALARTQMRWLPELSSITEFSYIEDRRVRTGDILYTRTLGQSVEGQPTPRTSLRVEYRRYSLSALLSQVPSYRENIGARASWQMTNALTFNGEITLFRDPSRTSRAVDGMFSWMPAPKWFLSGGISQSSTTGQTTSTLINAQVLFRWTIRTDVNFGYSFSHYNQASLPDVTALRLGFNTRF